VTRQRNPLRLLLGELRRVAGALSASREEHAMRE